MTLVADASVVVEALARTAPDAAWAEGVLGSDDLAAPHLMPAEAASILRRAVLGGRISEDAGSLAQADLLDLPVVLHPYEPLASRVWDLRRSVTVYDAWYVALAEELDVPLATLDVRLARANGPRCAFVTPDG